LRDPANKQINKRPWKLAEAIIREHAAAYKACTAIKPHTAVKHVIYNGVAQYMPEWPQCENTAF